MDNPITNEQGAILKFSCVTGLLLINSILFFGRAEKCMYLSTQKMGMNHQTLVIYIKLKFCSKNSMY